MNTINFFHEKTAFRLRGQKRIGAWLEQCALQEKHRIQSLNVIFCSDAALRKMNKNFLNHDYFTDIITFPVSLPGSKNIDGEIYISIDSVRSNARDYGVRLYDELCRVMVHGVLHLCGYNDHAPKEQSLMRAKENFYLQSNPLASGIR